MTDHAWVALSESLAERAAKYPQELWIPAVISGRGEDAVGSVSLLRLWVMTGGRTVIPPLLLRRILWALDRLDASYSVGDCDADKAVQALRAARRRWERSS